MADYSNVSFKNNGKLKLLIIVGTRPEIIRLAAVINKTRKYFDVILAHTGQNYDYNLNGVFFHDLQLADPEVRILFQSRPERPLPEPKRIVKRAYFPGITMRAFSWGELFNSYRIFQIFPPSFPKSVSLRMAFKSWMSVTFCLASSSIRPW